MLEQTYLNLLRRFGLLLVLAAILGGVSAYYLTRYITPTYEATATLLITQPDANPAANAADLAASARVTAVMQQLVTTRPVLERAAQAGVLGLTAAEIPRQVEVSVVQELFLRITGSASTPGEAQAVASTVADAFIAHVRQGVATGPTSITVIEPAGLPSQPVAPSRTLNAAAGGMLGLVGAAVLALLYVRLDDVVKDASQVQEATGLPAMGLLPTFGKATGPEQLRAAMASGSPFTEAVRSVRANLSLAMGPRHDGGFDRNVVLITSVRNGDGGNLAASNLALAFGRAGYRTLLIDCDFRHPTIQGFFEIAGDGGLGTVLSRRTDPDYAVHATHYADVFVLPAGYTKPTSVDELGSAEMRELVDRVRHDYDVVLLTAPATLEVSDAATVSPMTDLVLLVGWSGRTRGRDLQRSIETLERSGGVPVGVILNGAGKEPPTSRGGQSARQQLPSARLPVEVAAQKHTPD